MTFTNDQYVSLDKLCRWYRKYQHQFIDVFGAIGTGTWDLIQAFIEASPLDPREVMYLSYDQKRVLELAYNGFHAYHLNNRIYSYQRFVDLNSLPLVNTSSTEIISEWKKKVRSGIDNRYRLIVVLDATLLNIRTLTDISSFGLPVILVGDPLLLPSPDSYAFARDPNILLRESNPELIRNPLVYFAHRIARGDPLEHGTYETVNILPRKQMNLFNIRTSDMNITMGEGLRAEINNVYRSNVLKQAGTHTVVGERLLLTNTLYRERLKNPDNPKVRVYLTKGSIVHVERIPRHAAGTRFVNCDLRLDGYHDPFTDIFLDRYSLTGTDPSLSKQDKPMEYATAEYAYALTVPKARLSHWAKVTVTLDRDDFEEGEIYRRMAYTAVTRATESLVLFT